MNEMSDQNKRDNHYQWAYGDLFNRYQELAIKFGKFQQVYSETVAHLHQVQDAVKKLEDNNKQKERFIQDLKQYGNDSSFMRDKWGTRPSQPTARLIDNDDVETIRTMLSPASLQEEARSGKRVKRA